MVEYLGGVNPRSGCLPLLHNLRAHHVELLLLVVQVVIQMTQLRAVVTHRKVLMADKKDNYRLNGTLQFATGMGEGGVTGNRCV